MSKYTLLVIFGPRAASADCAQMMAASDATTKMRDALAKIILGEEGKSSDGDERALRDNSGEPEQHATPSAHCP